MEVRNSTSEKSVNTARTVVSLAVFLVLGLGSGRAVLVNFTGEAIHSPHADADLGPTAEYLLSLSCVVWLVYLV